MDLRHLYPEEKCNLPPGSQREYIEKISDVLSLLREKDEILTELKLGTATEQQRGLTILKQLELGYYRNRPHELEYGLKVLDNLGWF